MGRKGNGGERGRERRGRGKGREGRGGKGEGKKGKREEEGLLTHTAHDPRPMTANILSSLSRYIMGAEVYCSLYSAT